MCYLLVLLFRWPISCHHLLMISNNQQKYSIFNIYGKAENYPILKSCYDKFVIFDYFILC